MNPSDWERLESLFERCSALPEAERSGFLDRECTEAPDLRAELERLLRSQTEGEEFLRPLAERSLEIGRRFAERIGRYRVVRLLGRGGMGLVFLAEQHRPKRLVALKVVRPGVATRRMLRRFEMEGQVLGRLQHPGIAQIYEADTADTGDGPQPYFVMEYVRGRSLLEYAKMRALGTRERLELLTKICEAVQHAHRRGIIHRDLKPTNILVDDDGRPKILDFGVARATDADVKNTTLATDIGQLIGTVPYMSPEQTAGDPDELDTRSDVYALGVLGYELLTGRLPYDLANKMVHEAVRAIREDPPTPLSTSNRIFRGDLETIFGKALSKEPSRRYQAATDLSSDIDRYLRDEPIEARPPSMGYQVRMFARRKRTLFASLVVVAVILVLATIVSVTFGARAVSASQAAAAEAAERAAEAERRREAEEQALLAAAEAERGREEAERAREETAREHERAQAEAETARAANAFLDEMLSAADPEKTQGREVTVRFLLDEASARLEAGALQEQPETEAAVHRTLGRTYQSLGLYGPADLHLSAAVETRRALFRPAHPATVESVRDLAELTDLRDRPKSALALYREALALLRQDLGDAHLDLAESMIEQVGVLERAGTLATADSDLREAEDLLREALEIRRNALGADHPDVADAMTHLAVFLARGGRHEEALPLQRSAVAICERFFGAEHAKVAKAREGLAAVVFLSGEREEAVGLMRDVLAMRRRLGEDRDTVSTLMSMAEALRMTGRYDEAEPLYRELVAFERRWRGDEHPNVAHRLYALANMLAQMGDAAAAVPPLEEAIWIEEAAQGPANSDVLGGKILLADLYRRLGRLDDAEAVLGEALAVALERKEPMDPQRGQLLILQMKLLADRGEVEEARATFASIAALATEFPDDLLEDEDISGSWATLGSDFLEAGQPAVAEPVLRACLAIRQKAQAGHWLEYNAMSMLGAALTGMGELEEAEPLLVDAHVGLVKVRDTIPVSIRERRIREARERLVQLYTARANPDEAARWQAELDAAQKAIDEIEAARERGAGG